MVYGRKWKPSKIAVKEFAQKMKRLKGLDSVARKKINSERIKNI